MELNSHLQAPVVLPSGNKPIPIDQEAGRAPEAVWTFWRRENSLRPYWTLELKPRCQHMVKALHAIFLTPSLQEAREGQGMWHVRERRGEVHAGFCGKILTESDHLEEQVVDGRIILKRIFTWDRKAWTDCSG
jgi:hypothetical protein